MPGYMDVPKAIETAKQLLGNKRVLTKQIDTVRSDLRNAVTRKECTAADAQWVEETFPVRERNRKSKAKAAA